MNIESDFKRISALIVGCIGVCLTFYTLGVFESLELKSLDLRFALRDFAGFDSRDRSKKIAIIEIDNQSSKRISDPLLIWDPYFAKVIASVDSAAPKSLALDVLWLRSIEDFVELKGGSLRKPLVQALMKVASHNRLVLALSPNAEETSLGKHAILIGAENFADVRLDFDKDQIVRRQSLYKPGVDSSSRPLSFPSFSLLVAGKNGFNIKVPGEHFLINFSNKEMPFSRYSFAEVLAKTEQNDTEFFKREFFGKIVLIGTTNSLLDRHSTPLGAETPGIYIHAFAIDTLIGEKNFTILGTNFTYLLIFLACILLALITWKLPPSLGLLAGTGYILFYLSLSIILFLNFVVVPVAAPILSILFCAGTMFGFRIIVIDREKRRLSTTFRQYMNSKLVDVLMAAPEAAGLLGTRREICVLFSDIRGFTQLSENLAPETVVEFLNTYLSSMSQIILDYDGTVDKFIGDGIMAYFGAPVANPNSSLNAVKAALAMQKKLQELNEIWSVQGKSALKIGIGIHTGDAVIGNIGSKLKMDYTAIGDTVNLAARVEGMTKELNREIVITNAVVIKIEKFFGFEDLGQLPIRGRSAVHLFAVQGEK